jgi:hypothetical protein
MVCKGEIDMMMAAHYMATDWIAAYEKYLPQVQKYGTFTREIKVDK